MKENIKIALLGVIAVTLIADTFLMGGDQDHEVTSGTSDVVNNIAASPLNPSPNSPSITPEQPPAPQPKLSETRAKTVMDFAETSHHFGTIKQDTKNTKVFTFTNNGSEPLIIEDAKGSCGCTVPEYPKEPIPPGGEGEIKVVYSPGKQQGAQSKRVTITANTDPITTTLDISAEVEVVETGEEG